MGRERSTNGRNEYKILAGKPEGKTSSERTRIRCEDNIRSDLKEIGLEDVDWIHLAQDRDQWWGIS
jgi:hypothetical protein